MRECSVLDDELKNARAEERATRRARSSTHGALSVKGVDCPSPKVASNKKKMLLRVPGQEREACGFERDVRLQRTPAHKLPRNRCQVSKHP